MWINLGIPAFSLLLGSLITWVITHIYYRKSLANQEQTASKEIEKWKALVNNQKVNLKEHLILKYTDTAVEEYNKSGTPKRAIDTFDVPESKKAKIYDDVMMRVKGRLGKSNPYKK